MSYLQNSQNAGVTICAVATANAGVPSYKRDAVTGKIDMSDSFDFTNTVDTLEVDYIAVPFSDDMANAPQDFTLGAGLAADITAFPTDYTGAVSVADLGPAGASGVAKVYPLFTLESMYAGEFYNNLGISIEPMIGANEDALLTGANIMGYDIKVYDKSSGTKYITKTIYSDASTSFNFVKDSVHPLTNRAKFFTDVFPSYYGNTTDATLPLTPPEFKEIVIHSGLDALLTEMITVELAAQAVLVTAGTLDAELLQVGGSAVPDDERVNLLNFLTLKTTTECEYEAIRSHKMMIDSAPALAAANYREIDFGHSSTLWLANGRDGDVQGVDGSGVPFFELAIIGELAKYDDIDSEVIDTAINVESVFYDSGFTLDTKLELAKLISFRADIVPVMATYVFNEDSEPQTMEEMQAIGAAIKSRFAMVSESEEFGTPGARTMVVMSSGISADNTYKYRMPATLDLAVKASRYMGAGNGKWNGTYRFSRQPGNIITELKDIEPSFIPKTIKENLYKTGLVWADPDDRLSYFYPSTQTIYNDDTSILNVFTTNIAIANLIKLNDSCHRTFTGATDLTNAELKEAVETFITAGTTGKYDGQLTVVPEVTYTRGDIDRGYSWHLKVKLYGNVGKTVQISHIEARRASELEG